VSDGWTTVKYYASHRLLLSAET